MLRRLFLLLFLCVAGSRIASAYTSPQDVAALKSLMKRWSNLPPKWGKSNDPCGAQWEGISCDTNSRVTRLNLFGMNIGGTLSDDIGSLTELTMLDLSSNRELGGPLTPAIGKLIKLDTLALIGCSFSGVLPEELGNILQLRFLALNSNQFTGSIPASLGKLSKLFWLDLADNQLSGPLPTSKDNGTGLDQLLKAQHFHLNKNQISGSLPEYLFNSSMILQHILLDRNNLTGPIPASLGGIAPLLILRLDDNNFVGGVPANITNLPKLQVLTLANNKLTGQIPNLTVMASLENVDLSNNNFDPSEVPSWFSTLSEIMTLTIQSGRLYGQLPKQLFSFPKLQQVILNDNNLNGTLDMGNNISMVLNLVNLQNNNITSVSVYNNSSQKNLMLTGNPVCRASLLSETMPCQGEQETAAPSPFNDIDCEKPFMETFIFRAPSFGDFRGDFVSTFKNSVSKQLNSCTPIQLGLPDFYLDGNGYLTVVFKICPVNKKYFHYSEVLNCFNLTTGRYVPPENFGPYFVKTRPYLFKDKASRGILIGALTGSLLLVIGLVLVGFYAIRQKKRAQRLFSLSNPFASWGSMGEDSGEAPKLSMAKCFTYEELKSCTNDFREINVIGSGGYGKVYRGKLPDGQMVAIKRSKHGSMQGGLEFKTEIELLSRVHHKNLVGLVGFCFEKGERMLVYEFISNGSLSEGLSGMKGIHLDWNRRLHIALDSARGLAYLHDHADPPIIHRDVKSTNILLDDKLTAKVADFGLSLLVSDSEEGEVTAHVKGTVGYLDPEYYVTQQLTAKSDVYSFGVVMLELVVAKPPIHDHKYIVREVKMALDTEDDRYCGLKEVMDPVLRQAGHLLGFRRFLQLALQCVDDVAADRPTMNNIVKEIEAIMQDSGMKSVSVSSSSFSIDSGTLKGAPGHLYSDVSSSSTSGGVDMSSKAFEYSGGLPSNINVKMRGV